MWAKFKQSFHDSEVILLARLQVIAGVVWQVLIHTDLSPIITNQEYLTYWLMASGVITEMARKSRATFTDVDDQPPNNGA